MAYKHGVFMSEVPTSVVPMTEAYAGLPVIFGTAPLHLAANPAEVNRPQLCYSYAEAVEYFGYSDDWKQYTLCEAMYTLFSLFARGPVIFVNVLNPKKHKTSATDTEKALTSGRTVLTDAVLASTLKVKTSAAGEPLKEDVDYTVDHDDTNNLVITALKDGKLASSTKVFVSYDALDASAVKEDDIIGGVDVETGAYEGLETLNQVFPLTRLVPGFVLAPGWAEKPSVAAVMAAKAANINSHFQAQCLCDVPTDQVRKYSDVPTWKEANSYTGKNQVVCWPMTRLDNRVIHMSLQVLGAALTADSANDDVPYVSPSNHSLQANGLCLADGTEVVLGPDLAEYLNGQGVVTGLNFIGGWKVWGNRTGCYPATTDPKDSFIPVRRMFNWIDTKIVQTYWAKVDGPINKRLIQTVVDSVNIWLNGLQAQGAILGGRIEFRTDENPTTSLADGKAKFHILVTPPTPARELDFVLEYDVDYFTNLFANV